MPDKAVHIIHKQCYQIGVTYEQQGKHLQQQLQDINLRYILPAMSNKLDELFADEEMVMIDKIELNIGNLYSNARPEEWVEKILAALESSVKSLDLPEPDKQPVEVKKINRFQHAIQVFIYFLRTGMLFPQTVFRSISEVKAILILIHEHEAIELKQELIKFSSQKNVIQRLSMLQPDELFFFLKLLIPTLAQKEWQNLLEQLTSQKIISSIRAVTENKKEVPGLNITSIRSNILFSILQIIFNAAREKQQITIDELMTIAEENIIRVVTKKINDTKANDNSNSDKNDELSVEEQSVISKEGIFISNCGTCLLAAYLPTFFKALGLCDGEQFYNEAGQQHAVYVLHYLATGEEGASEEKIVFAKLLCSWPLQMPCFNEYDLTPAEKEESNELLKAVIGHWQALKNTSPDGLREAFLQRSAKLSEEVEQYLLQVEQQSIDILLEQVPWTFRRIKLPWMKKPVIVEWY